VWLWKRTTETQHFLLFTVCFADVRHVLIGFTKKGPVNNKSIFDKFY